jgi:Protein of unknown function (DUF962)
LRDERSRYAASVPGGLASVQLSLGDRFWPAHYSGGPLGHPGTNILDGSRPTIGVAILCGAFPLQKISASVGTEGVWAMTAAFVVIGWALQIVGHSVFERRRPALLDNPIHTVCVAMTRAVAIVPLLLTSPV